MWTVLECGVDLLDHGFHLVVLEVLLFTRRQRTNAAISRHRVSPSAPLLQPADDTICAVGRHSEQEGVTDRACI